jgi:hypothetical protein
MKSDGIVLGAALGLGFWFASESSVPADANCSYLAAPATDLAAFAGGSYCAVKGAEIDEPLVAAFGVAVVVIHTLQYLKHKA